MRWAAALILIFLCVISTPWVSWGDNFSDSQLNSGIRNSDAYSYLLIEDAHKDRAHAVSLLRKALEYSPDLPAVYFELSKAVFSLSGEGILNSVDYIIQGIDAYSRNLWWSFTLTGSLVLSVIFSFAAAFALIVFVRLFADIPLVIHDIEESRSRGLILAVIMLLSVASPLLFLGGMLLLIGLYMKKHDRFTVYVFLILLVCYPVFSKMATTYLKTSSSGVFKAILKVKAGKDSDYALSALKDSVDYVPLYSYALALKRKGRYDEAIAVYKKLLATKADPGVYVNLGNCYVGLYNFDERQRSVLNQATEAYTSAVNMKPITSAYYNLSQVSREMLDFARGEQYFKSALAVDRVAVSGYRTIADRNVNRFVIDEPLPSSEIWDFVFKRFYSASSGGLAAVLSPAISLMAIILIILFYLLDSIWHQHAVRCRKCGTIICNKCEKRLMWGEMCPQCFGSLVKLDELDVKERVAWLLSIYEQQRRRRDTTKALSFTLPGLSYIYAGRILPGFLMLWPFLFFLVLIITLMTLPDSELTSHAFFKWAALWSGAVLYLAFHYITQKRIAKGWL
jgi:tetratricopeptide (TPR) repeat protein